jgi:hypothetical protein
MPATVAESPASPTAASALEEAQAESWKPSSPVRQPPGLVSLRSLRMRSMPFSSMRSRAALGTPHAVGRATVGQFARRETDPKEEDEHSPPSPNEATAAWEMEPEASHASLMEDTRVGTACASDREQ